MVIPRRYQAPAGYAPTQAGETTIYFTPQDEDTSTTVIFLYNTSAVSAVVHLETYELDGSKYVDEDISVPPHELVRICADEVSTFSSTWQDVVWINFRSRSTYGMMVLPAGVRAEAYVVWNGGSTYDPLQEVPTLPIRFSTSAAAVYLPAAPRGE